MADKIFVVGEAKDGAVTKATQECIAEARRANGGAQITCVLLGNGVSGAAESAGKAGADAVAVADDAALADYHLERYVATVAAGVGEANLVLFPATTHGKEMAAQLAAKLGVGMAAECTKVTLGADGDPRAVRPMYAGKVLATVKLTGPKPRPGHPATERRGPPRRRRGQERFGQQPERGGALGHRQQAGGVEPEGERQRAGRPFGSRHRGLRRARLAVTRQLRVAGEAWPAN